MRQYRVHYCQARKRCLYTVCFPVMSPAPERVKCTAGADLSNAPATGIKKARSVKIFLLNLSGYFCEMFLFQAGKYSNTS